MGLQPTQEHENRREQGPSGPWKQAGKGTGFSRGPFGLFDCAVDGAKSRPASAAGGMQEVKFGHCLTSGPAGRAWYSGVFPV